MQRPYRPRNSNRREQVVEDLREKLNRIKQEKTLNAEVGKKNLPPPDPAYNFLKDPLRGDNCTNLDNEKKSGNKDCHIKYEAKCASKSNDKQKNPSQPFQNEKNKYENRNSNFDKNEAASRNRQNWKNNTPQDKVQPPNWKDRTLQSTKPQSVNNIKVTVSNESGERKCIMDESVLVQLPVKARKNYNNTDRPKTKKWPQGLYSDKNKDIVSDTTIEKNEEKIEKQIVTENEHQTSTSNESKVVETVVNDDKLVISKEKTKIIADINKTEQKHEEETKPAETIKEDEIKLSIG